MQQPALPDAAGLHQLYLQMRDKRYLEEEPGRRTAARRLLDLLAAQLFSGLLERAGLGPGSAQALVRLPSSARLLSFGAGR